MGWCCCDEVGALGSCVGPGHRYHHLVWRGEVETDALHAGKLCIAHSLYAKTVTRSQAISLGAASDSEQPLLLLLLSCFLSPCHHNLHIALTHTHTPRTYTAAATLNKHSSSSSTHPAESIYLHSQI